MIIKLIDDAEVLEPSEIDSYWELAVNGDTKAFDVLKYNYMKELIRIKPLYSYLDEEFFYNILENSVIKSLERGIKFAVDDFQSYMTMASNTYFKHLLAPESESLQLPSQLIRAFSKLEEVYTSIPNLTKMEDNYQIKLLANGFEYPLFSTKLLYYSFIKWRNNTLRQVDIDLTVNLLPAPQRVEWEIFYEKPLEDVVNAINLAIDKEPKYKG